MFYPDIEAAIARGAAHRKNMHELGARPGFRPLDLGHWLRLCAEAGVPAVPATLVASINPQLLTEFIEPHPDHVPTEAQLETLQAFWAKVQEARALHGYMLRWSCCACAKVKHRLSTGEPRWNPDFLEFFGADDFRAFDLLCEFYHPEVGAYLRPWLRYAVHEGYPVEYRAFVLNGEIQGVSNYYPQRDLPDNDETSRDVETVLAFTRRLIAAQREPINLPNAFVQAMPKLNCWTADFARLADGAIVFLEGGPPHLPGGAHMCCFKFGEIEGVALSNRNAEGDV